MGKNIDHSKVIDTHSEVFGKKVYLMLMLDSGVDKAKAAEAIVRTLKCDVGYAEERLKEAEEFGTSYLYASWYEHCELVQALFDRDKLGLVTQISEN